ncbi:MAG: mannose-1-phosphate guanylyltransferase/mannose-6-phosphate isomerase [Nitrospirae bacterium]|nr:MAG: mannose-1-phosphate guanylyltransferase/mannose-6-phosphate isomerase [Nitrospirota bacterium]
MKALILAGGSGTRLWPLSRKNYPKQFLKLNGDKSLLAQTVERLTPAISLDDIVVLTNGGYRFYVRSELGGEGHIVLEPAARNTAPAIALGIKYCIEKLGCGMDEVVMVSPSDHVIRPVEAFSGYLRTASDMAKKDFIVTFGIRPTKPETGYGYIKAGEKIGDPDAANAYKVERFAEKPDRDTAGKYVADACYYWNSGMYVFKIGAMLSELKLHAPEIDAMMEKSFDEFTAEFESLPNISVDYAVMEKSSRAAVVPLDIYWNDIGSWDSVFEVLEKDGSGNAGLGDTVTINTDGSLIIGGKRLIATIGMKDCLIVDTGDALLIAKKGEAQKVRDIVETLKNRQRIEAVEHTTVYRPWGSYTVLEEGPRYKIKRIAVNPGEKLSLQKHYHRSEHWVVIKGTAKVTTGAKEITVHENESVFVPKSELHRLENPGKIPLEIIEVQNGEYVGEDDIERYDDIYQRHR